LSHLIYVKLPKFQSFFGYRSFAFFESLSKFYGNFASFFFYKQERANFLEKSKHIWSVNYPQISLFPVFFSAGSFVNIGMTSKIGVNPINEDFIGRRNVNTKVVFSPNVIWGFIRPKYNTSFSIQNSSQIYKFFSTCFKQKIPTSKLNYSNLNDMEQVNLTVNVASEKTREIVKRCSRLYGNIERIAEMTIPLKLK